MYFRFKSNHFRNGLGFKILYEATNVTSSTFIGTCGGEYTSSHGFIASPSYPYDPYPNNANCIYVVSQPSGTCINITITDMDIEYSSSSDYYDYYGNYDLYQFDGNTCFDYLEIRDGNSGNSELLGKYCGDGNVLSLPISLLSTEEYLWIR